MSRYVEVAIAWRSLDEVEAALARVGLACERADDGLMLAGGIECSGAPVQLRVAAGPFGTIEDFGFAAREGALVLVCGELDRTRLEATLVPALAQAIAALRIAAAPQLEIVAQAGERIVVKRR